MVGIGNREERSEGDEWIFIAVAHGVCLNAGLLYMMTGLKVQQIYSRCFPRFLIFQALKHMSEIHFQE